MESEEEDELAELRAARDAQSGPSAIVFRALKSRRGNVGLDGLEGSKTKRLTAPDAALEEETIEESDLRQNFPLSFGEQERPAVNLEKIHKTTARPATETPAERNGHIDDGAALAMHDEQPPVVGPVLSADANALAEADDPYSLPVTHEVTLEGMSGLALKQTSSCTDSVRTREFIATAGHGKAVSCVDVDYSGSRLLSGSRDNSLRIFDFNGMKSTMQSFRHLEPCEGHPMLATSWSPTGDAFLAVSGSAQVKVYDRDGIEQGESIRGDMYIRDQRNTKGHISPAKGGQWHPVDRATAMTCGEDGTLRLWDTTTAVQKTVIKPTLQRAVRVCVSACTYNSTGSSIAGGLVDGSIQIWDAKGSMGRSAAVGAVPVPKAQMMGKQEWRYVSGGASALVRGAHMPDTDITSLAFSRDNLTLLSRAADDTLKVWDLRKFKVPLHIYSDLPNLMSTTGVCFSPDDRLAVTGTSAERDGAGGSLVFIDLAKEAVVRRVAMPSHVVALHWSQRLNQIFVGTGDKSAGAVRVLYNPSMSERGVLLCAHRKPRAKDPFDFEAPLVIHTPHALPLFREPRGSKRHLDAKPKDAALRFKPDVGSATLQGTGTGGRIGATGGTLLTQFVLKNQGKLQNPREEDVRAKILRHEGNDPSTAIFSEAYKKTQPNRIFAEEEKEEGDK